jgi:hypothetical protein
VRSGRFLAQVLRRSASEARGLLSHRSMKLRVLAAVLLAAIAAAGAPQRRRVVLIVENASDDRAATAQVVPAAQSLLARRGYEIAEVREGSAAELPGALAESHADAAIALSIRFHFAARGRRLGPAANPAVGLVAQLYEKGAVEWRNSIGVIGEGGTDAQLEATACKRLFWTMPAPLGPQVEERAASEPQVPVYEVPIDRLRSGTGPRFPLRTDRPRR